MKIIFPNGSGGIAIIHPTGELPIEHVAVKDVPVGIPYLIVDDADIPTDRTYRDAWKPTAGMFDTPDGIGGQS